MSPVSFALNLDNAVASFLEHLRHRQCVADSLKQGSFISQK